MAELGPCARASFGSARAHCVASTRRPCVRPDPPGRRPHPRPHAPVAARAAAASSASSAMPAMPVECPPCAATPGSARPAATAPASQRLATWTVFPCSRPSLCTQLGLDPALHACSMPKLYSCRAPASYHARTLKNRCSALYVRIIIYFWCGQPARFLVAVQLIN
jgi:hypothetical protein